MSVRKAFRVCRVGLDEVVADLPTLQNYSTQQESVDILVIPAGFEPRILAIPGQLANDGIKVAGDILVGRYKTNRDDNDRRYAELGPLLMSLDAPIFEFDAEDPIRIGQAIATSLKKFPEDRVAHLAFDISGASSTLILSVMAALAEQSRRVRLTIYYVTAAVYDQPPELKDGLPPLQLFGDVPRETGVDLVSHNALCAGFHHDHLPAMVIALPSMYTERLESCLSHLNVGPMTGSQDNLFWILPSTDTQEHKWRQEHVRRAVESLVKRYQGIEEGSEALPSEQVATCDVSSYQNCMKLIIEQVDRHPGRNISIVHMGTKLQAIGVALAVAARGEIAVVSARPASFNAQSYSDGVGSRYQLVFDDLGEAIRSLAKVGSLKVDA